MILQTLLTRNRNNQTGKQTRFRILLPLATVLLTLAIATGHDPDHSQTDRSTDNSAESPADTTATWWAFQPLRRPAVPTIRGPAANDVASPVDAFLLESLAQSKQRFAPIANPRTRLRRAAFGLIGLPPGSLDSTRTPSDPNPYWWARTVDRLLANPHYGEAQGRNWLDLVRYAETDGFNADALRPLAYHYRDYVIRAFNQDRAYSRFVQEQIAGDELFPESTEALVATGFNRMWADESNASNILLARQDALNDLTSNVGSVFLGISIGCAQCHDHKFDPLLQVDFYRLQAHFAGIVLTNSAPVGTPDELNDYQAQLKQWLSQTRSLRHELQAIELKGRDRAFAVKRRKFPTEVLQAVDTLSEERTARQHQLAFWSERQLPDDEKKLSAALSTEDRSRRAELKKQLESRSRQRPQPPNTLQAMATLEVASGPARTFLLAGGSHDAPLDEVAPATPEVFLASAITPANTPTRRPGSSGRRAQLARWLTADNHPLTSRVMVNRIWQSHFGHGLIQNANDLGQQTPPPIHQRLLDWLAVEFVESGWSIKHMHRLIMNSNAYQQSGREATTSDDPKPYSFFPRQRLSAERIRDAILHAAGQLDTRLYGTPVHPKLPPDFSSRHTWKTSASPADRSRRSVYIHAKRNLPYPLLQVFDQPDMHESCARRSQTTVAPQALVLLNSNLVLELARGVVKRVRKQADTNDVSNQVRQAWQIVLGRYPRNDELDQALTFLTHQAANSNATQPATRNDHALLDLCHVLINTNEFLYVD
jgi:hypothetical protein